MKIRKKTNLEILKDKPSIEKVKKLRRMPCILVVDSIRSLYNIGSLFRSADAVLLEKIILCGISGKEPNKKIAKTALGAEKVVPFEFEKNIVECVEKLKAEGRKIYGLELCEQSLNFRKVKYQWPCVLVVGNEIDGIDEMVVNLLDRAVDIEMLGRTNSLNVATAFAVVGYEMLNQWKNGIGNN